MRPRKQALRKARSGAPGYSAVCAACERTQSDVFLEHQMIEEHFAKKTPLQNVLIRASDSLSHDVVNCAPTDFTEVCCENRLTSMTICRNLPAADTIC